MIIRSTPAPVSKIKGSIKRKSEKIANVRRKFHNSKNTGRRVEDPVKRNCGEWRENKPKIVPVNKSGPKKGGDERKEEKTAFLHLREVRQDRLGFIPDSESVDKKEKEAGLRRLMTRRKGKRRQKESKGKVSPPPAEKLFS